VQDEVVMETECCPKIKFVDFWPDFQPAHNPLYDVLAAHFRAQLCEDPDYLIYSVFGGEHLFNRRYDRCIKILWTGESVRPNFSVCDYALSFDYLDDPRHLRWPLYALAGQALVRPEVVDAEQLLAEKTGFCNFLYSNANGGTRIEFFRLLSEYKRVDSGGAVLNNIGRRIRNKLDWISGYKFTIAFENSSHDGYVTEKLSDPLSVYSVPIYWGSSRAAEDFDPSCFINCHACKDLREVVERVATVDRDDELYKRYLRAPCFTNNVLNPCCRPEYLVAFFDKVFADKRPRNHEKPSLMEIVSNPGGWSVLS